MKTLKLNIIQPRVEQSFQIRYLGLHERIGPGFVDRPGGTRDYLFMLFYSDVRIRIRGEDLNCPAASHMIWTPKDVHFYGNNSIVWNHSWFNFSGHDISRILKTSRIPVGKPFPAADPSLMERYLLETITELNSWRGPDEIILGNLFENFVRTLARHLFNKTQLLAPNRLREVKRHISEHFAEKLRLPDLARRAGWSVPHLCTEFKRFYGVPIVQYIQRLRMNQATYLLCDHNRSISEIAGLVGYPDLYTFSKMFKRCLGLSPRSFRHIG